MLCFKLTDSWDVGGSVASLCPSNTAAILSLPLCRTMAMVWFPVARSHMAVRVPSKGNPSDREGSKNNTALLGCHYRLQRRCITDQKKPSVVFHKKRHTFIQSVITLLIFIEGHYLQGENRIEKGLYIKVCHALWKSRNFLFLIKNIYQLVLCPTPVVSCQKDSEKTYSVQRNQCKITENSSSWKSMALLGKQHLA